MSRRPRNPTPKRRTARRPAWLTGVGLLLALTAQGAQVLEGPILGFAVDEADRATGRRHWLLRAERAVPLPDGRYELPAGARLEMYDEAGGTNLILVASHAFFDPKSKIVSSPEALRVDSGQGGFAIEGRGFGYVPSRGASSSQPAGVLTISNEVHTTVHKNLAKAPTKPSTASSSPPTAGELVHLYSRRLTLQPESAVFRDEVRVEDPQGRLTCAQLTARFTERDWQLLSLLAERNIRMQSGELEGQAERATYATDSELVELSGNPEWRMGTRAGSADLVVVDRGRQQVKATGHVAITLPSTALTSDGAWLPEERRRPAPSPAGGPGATEAKTLQLTANEAEFQPDATRTNVTLGVFRGNVRVRDDRGQLLCDRMNLATVGRDHEIEKIVAEDHVQVAQGESRAACSRAEYAAATGTVELTGHPTWRVGQREGESDRLWLDSRNQNYRAVGQVKMRMPSSALASQSWLTPTPAAQSAERATPVATNRPAELVELTCDTFEYTSATTTHELDCAVYQGHVLVIDPGKARLACAILTAMLVPGTNQVQTIVAEHEVVVHAQTPSGVREARGDVATFTAASRSVELTATNRVEILVTDARGSTRATGSRATYDGGRDAFELDGRPLVTSPQGVLQGDRVFVDQGHAALVARGQWSLRIPLKTLGLSTNALDRLADPLKKPRR
jgi:lipopolysaccharide export system protein LptA